MPCPMSETKIKDLILQTFEIEEQAGKLLLQIDENKKRIQKFFDENNIKIMEVPISLDKTTKKKVNVVCKKFERATIKYDVDKLKEKLDDEMFIEVTKRSYTIPDINAMIKLVKDSGVRARDFKALIEAKITPNTEAIKRLYDVGELDMNMLKGTYQATISKSIKISEETGDKD